MKLFNENIFNIQHKDGRRQLKQKLGHSLYLFLILADRKNMLAKYFYLLPL